MKIHDYVDNEALEQQIADGMVKRQIHPSLPLSILNYTQKAQYTPELWNETTDKCRGLIFNLETKEIVARPFVKFWNYADARHPETMPENFPAIVPSITRKFDGSLGILYAQNGTWMVATRGSFTSDQALWATGWLNRRQPFTWPEGYTPLVEIIYPENQIVVKYDFSGLVLLASVHIETGEEMPRSQLLAWAAANGIVVTQEFDREIESCIGEDAENEEGYVVAWHRPGTWPLRVKVKMETYCRLHRLLTGTNPVTVWEMLKDGLGLESVTMNAPADFVKWVTDLEISLRAKYMEIENAALTAMLEYQGEKIISSPEQRKQFAAYATQKQPLTPILFSVLDGKDYAPIIWKMIRPRANDMTFKVDEE